ncbi:MAG: hypothetical protein HRT88_09215 [Lentisphaeraceae bacterium]|nr:hypothetical protein [Lentisphaeraceae bacterium]
MLFTIHEEAIWLPVRTKPRCEKKFIRFCDKYSVTSYLPIKIKMNNIRNKMVRSELPMFPGYAFACLTEENRRLLSMTNTVATYVKLDRLEEAQLIGDLENIVNFEVLQKNGKVLVSPEIIAGEEVLITGGPLKGLMGIVEKRKGLNRVVVNVSLIQQSVSMEVDSEFLELER